MLFGLIDFSSFTVLEILLAGLTGFLLLFLFYLLGSLIPRLQAKVDAGRETFESARSDWENQTATNNRKLQDLQAELNHLKAEAQGIEKLPGLRRDLREAQVAIHVAGRLQQRLETRIRTQDKTLHAAGERSARLERAGQLARIVQGRCLARTEYSYGQYRSAAECEQASLTADVQSLNEDLRLIAGELREVSLDRHVERRHCQRLAGQIVEHRQRDVVNRQALSIACRERDLKIKQLRRVEQCLHIAQLDIHHQRRAHDGLKQSTTTHRRRIRSARLAVDSLNRELRSLQKSLY